MNDITEITLEQFLQDYTVVKNEIAPNDGFFGGMFDLSDEELQHLKRVYNENPKKIWTIIDGGGSDLYLVSGFWFINRLGYVITNEEWSGHMEFKI